MMRIITIKELCALLDEESKHYLHTPRRLFYITRQGGRVTRDGAIKLLVSVRVYHPDVAGVVLASGEKVYAPDLMDALMTERDQLAAEREQLLRDNADLAARIRQLEAARFRELLSESHTRRAGMFHSPEGNHGGN